MFGRAEERAEMVASQIAARGVTSARVLDAMAQVPRHLFTPQDCAHLAYEDRPLPIGHGQTISQPYMVASMTELLGPNPEDRVLEIGTGSGYQTAILARLCAQVVTVERIPELFERARECLGYLGCGNVTMICDDGTLGCVELAPYNGILVAAGSPRIPVALEEQLAEGGRLICPVGNRARQRLTKITRQGTTLLREVHTSCVFVPLRGQDAWPVGEE